MGEQHAGGVRSLVHHLIERVRAKHDVSLEELRGWRVEQVQNAINDARAEALADGTFSEDEAGRIENMSRDELIAALERSAEPA